MENIEDHDIGPLWAEHFPKRKESDASKTLCLVLMNIINERSLSIIPYGNWGNRMLYTLQLLDVPENQFNEF